MFSNDTKYLSLLGLAAVLAVAPAAAQNTSSAISGRVTGSDGKAIAGAKVEATHAESGSTNAVSTDEQGRYVLRGLRVGVPYTVVVSKDGKTEKREDVYLLLAQTSTIDLRLAAAQASLAAVTVTGTSASAFDSMAMGSGSRFNRQELDAFPSVKRSLQDYARLDPRMAQTDKERGEISAGGQNTRYNTVTVDGVKINDTFGLEANGLPTIKQPISIDAIQAVQVNLSNYDVTQKDYTGANINAVSKSGTNELKGSVYFVYRDEKFVGDRFSPTTGASRYPKFGEDTKGFTLGGPIIEDQLFFFTSYEQFTSTRAQPEFGQIGGSFPQTVSISQSQIDQIAAAAKLKGYNIGSVGTTAPVEVQDLLVKLDWNINAQHRANVRFASTRQSETQTGSINATSLTLDSSWWKQKKDLDSVVGQWFADWTPTFSTELKASQRNYDSNPLNNSNSPSVSFSFVGLAPAGAPTGALTSTRFLNTGTDFSRQFNKLSQKTQDFYLGANWMIDDHEVKFGGDYSATKTINGFFQGVNGSYTFGCVNSSGTFTYNNPLLAAGVVCGTTTPEATAVATILENFERGRPSSYSVQAATPGTTLDEGAANFSIVNTGLFLQDTWTVNDQLTLIAGARVDVTGLPDKPKANAAAGAATVAGSIASGSTTGVRNSGGFGMNNTVTPDGQTLFQPRFGFNYALDAAAKEKSQIRGGFGLFQGAAASVWLANPYSNTGLATRTYGCGTSVFSSCGTLTGLFSADPANQPTNISTAQPAANVDFLDPKLTQPAVWKMNLAYETQLPFGGLVAGAEVMATKNKAAVYYKQLNLGAPTAKGAADGRELYYTPKGLDPACWNASSGSLNTSATGCGGDWGARNRALSNPAFANVTQATQTDVGGGNTVTLSLTKPANDGFGWQVAYSRQSATDASPLSSSVANSNFNSRATFNPNEEVEANSAYLVKERMTGSINWSKAFFGNRKTTVGLFYEGRVGKPYSWVYKNDMNGDGVGGNDLMYIPKAPGSGEVLFFGADAAAKAATEANFWAVVDANKVLGDAKGGVAGRNSAFSDTVHSFDVRLSQELDGFSPKHKSTFILDIFNVGNLLNRDWGRTNEALFQSGGGNRRGFVNFAGIDPATGKYIYAVSSMEEMAIKQNALESQWALQATWKYEF
jgi:hypothetical protein